MKLTLKSFTHKTQTHLFHTKLQLIIFRYNESSHFSGKATTTTHSFDFWDQTKTRTIQITLKLMIFR